MAQRKDPHGQPSNKQRPTNTDTDTNTKRTRARRHLRLLPNLAPGTAAPLPRVVPLLRPDQPVTPAQNARLTTLAKRARQGDDAARELLWRAFAARLEPVILRCGRMAWQANWPRRNDRPWDLDDLRQEAWLAFADLAEQWDGEGSFVPFVTAYFPWRLRNAMRTMAPTRRTVALAPSMEPEDASSEIDEAESAILFSAILAALSPGDAMLLQMRVVDELSLGDIARQLGVNRRTISRRWARIMRVAREVVQESGIEYTGRDPR
jgi:RNA polymerase sigma factor (sigma-70 family)